jgi:hypothetical protein
MPETDTITAIHAHVCMNCASEKKNTVWVHGDDNAGIIGTHLCPECGKVEWRKWKIEPVKAGPQQAVAEVAQAGINLDTLIGYIVLAIGLALIGYGIFLYAQKWSEGCGGTGSSPLSTL